MKSTFDKRLKCLNNLFALAIAPKVNKCKQRVFLLLVVGATYLNENLARNIKVCLIYDFSASILKCCVLKLGI